MSAHTVKKGHPTVNKPSKTEAWYCFKKVDNTPYFNKKAKERREKAKFNARARKINQKKK